VRLLNIKNKEVSLVITTDNPFVKNHLVQGKAILPGLAYIDMLFQIAQTYGFDVHKTVLKNLTIFNPLIVGADVPIELIISVTESQGGWEIIVEGVAKRAAGIGDQNRKKYISAQLHQDQAVFFNQTIHVGEIKKESRSMIDPETGVYAPARQNGLVHRDIMKPEGTIYLTDKDCIAHLILPVNQAEDARDYLFHPALIDGSAMASSVAMQRILSGQMPEEQNGLFLPIFFESFSAAEPLNTECYARVPVSTIEMIKDVIYCDIEFFNSEGKQVGLLKRLTAKRVRSGEQIAAAVAKTLPVSTHFVNEIAVPGKSRPGSLEHKVTHIFSRYLSLRPDQIDPQKGFFDLGLESVHLLEIVKELEKLLNTTLNPTLMFEYNSIQELIAVFETELGMPSELQAPVDLLESCYEFYYHEPYLQDHLVFGKPALMGITHPACVIEELLQRGESLPIQLDRLQFVGGPVTPGENEIIHVRVVFEAKNGETHFRSEHYLNDANKVKPCLNGQYIKPEDISSDNIDVQALLKQGKRMTPSDLEGIYHAIPEFKIGELLKTITEAYLIDHKTMLLKVDLTGKKRKGNRDSFVFDPLLLNSCYYISSIVDNGRKDTIFVPLMIESLCVFNPITEISYIITLVNKATADYASFDSIIINDSGEIAAKVINASVKSVENPLKLENAAFDFSKDLISEVKNKATAPKYPEAAIAIIGVSGRYPQARNLEEFWRNLRDGKDCITEIPKERWDYSLYFDEDRNKPGKTYSKWGGFIDGVDQFDPLFFNISPREAEITDPQERLFLECVYETLEDAGYTRESLAPRQGSETERNVGVFVGVMNEEYQLYGVQEQIQGRPVALSGNSSSIANRVSYFCNFHGPSVAMDTMCSSSLTAIHFACQSILYGGCELAIAGGVNVLLHPNKYLLLAQGKFVSSKGRCESFGQGGDGYVPGEGVGAVLLKPLSKAIADGDQIYGIIKGSAINHGGKTSGYTVPNPNAQAEVIGQALQEAGIDPRIMSYVEAHGTGTSLGDPIEIAGLVKAFQKFTQDRQFCAIGSAKSNIGHCESAAGIAGITKILLQMKNGQIVPSLHSEELNPNIDFPNTPFIVQQELTEWERPVLTIDGETREYPRIAGISSFGAGGSNAHVVIEEYISGVQGHPALMKVTSHNPAIIILSAKNEERLKERAQQLLTAIKTQQFKDDNLADLAYTLQVGREAMEERLALVVSSLQELEETLGSFLEGREGIEDLYRGKDQRDNQLAILAADEEMRETIQKWIDRKKYGKLLDFWVKGMVFDWNRLYKDNKPRRISLPTYPFARERCWIPEIATKSIVGVPLPPTYIHPLLHQNTSNLSEQRYSSIFTGRENFLADHVVRGQKVLPEVAHLEMARAAVEQAVGAGTGLQLIDVVWAHPLIIREEPIQVNIGLYPEDNGGIGYEIYSETGAEDDGRLIYSQGRALLTLVAEIPVLDLKAVLAVCSESTLSATEIHEAFKATGIHYGLGYQGIEQIYVGQGQVLAKLSLSSAIAETSGQFMLHPGMMDAALQASIGFKKCIEGRDLSENQVVLPFALQELEVFGKSATGMWAWIRTREGSKPGDSVQKLDIELCDEQGNVCVRLKGLEIQEYKETIPQNVSILKAEEPHELMTFEEAWQEQGLPELSPVKLKTIVCFLSNPEKQQEMNDTLTTFDQQTKLIFISQSTTFQKQTPQNYNISRAGRNNYEEAFRSIREDYGEVEAVLYLWALEDSSCIKDYSCIMYIIQAMATAELRPKRVLLAANLEKDSLEGCYLESWIGFERSIGLILPNTQIATIYQATEPDQTSAMKDWARKLREELQIPKSRSVLYQGGKRYVYQIQPIPLPSVETPVRAGGTYLITGGCGGLGFLLAKHIAQKHPVNLALTGRSALDAQKQMKIKLLEELGSQVMYLQTNVCNLNAMKARVKQVRERFGKIDGVIHAAGIQNAQNILTKELVDFQKVIDPKIKGTQVLDQVLKEEPLDFICYFSSSAAILGDFGACDYAVGNRFQMAYAHYRNRQTSQGLSQGKAIVINWPLWKEGGMGFGNDENIKMYLKSSGQRILETAEGMAVFDRILGQNGIQYLIIVGQPSRVHRFLGLTEEHPVAPLINSSSPNKRSRVEMKGLSVEQCLDRDLKEQISNLIKISRDKIERDKNLADFGFDSVSLAQLASLLTNHYGIEITPSVFFGYSTLEKLTQYFLQEHQEAIRRFYREEDEKQFIPTNVPILQPPKIKRTRFSKNHSQNLTEPIAIIGMSGRFPGARNIDELWTILATGADMIKEIPKERFDWRQYYGGPNIEPGKTNGKWCGCIPGVSEFDPLFFEISPREAETMDPRQRLLLEESWKALEDAGYGAKAIKTQKIGMFAGVEQGDYQLLTKTEGSITSNHNAILASRLAYFLNLNGPVMAINTACSSGLVAAHQGILSLYNGECDAAIIAGVNLIFTPDSFIGMSQAGMLSGDGKCFAFDKRANGMVPGEAVAVIVCKRLSQAEADGDPVYAVIRGSGLNYDGKTNGITAPSGVSQTELLKMVYDRYGINPEEIEYIVTHGTGTRLGDPVEINALYDAFKNYTGKQGYCALTSTKTNLGHTFAASGLVSLISLVQALRHEMIPASLHCEQENDYINWEASPFFVNKTNKPWPGGKTRIGGVSAFGMSGTNAHMIVESYSPTEAGLGEEQPFYLLALSAKTRETLLEKALDLIKVLENGTIGDLLHISYTLLEGRQHFNHRCAIVVQEREDVIHVLKQVESMEKIPGLFQGKVPRDFTGQKAIEQYAQELLKQSRTLKENKPKYQEILFALADLYCQGYEMDWNSLYGGDKPGRIHLPTYPFTRERYWVPEVSQEPPMLVLKNEPGISENRLQDLIYLPVWEEQPLVASTRQDRPNTVLIVYSEASAKLEKTIQEYYRKKKISENVIKVQLSNQTKQLSENEWQCDIHDSNGFETCLQGYGLIGCLYFISECQIEEKPFDLDELVQSQPNNELQLLRLIKALKQKNTLQNFIDCYIITQDNYRISDTGVNPYGGGITGLAYSIAQGDHQFLVRNIDISAEDLITPQTREALLKAILVEAPSARGEVVKFQSGCRYKQEFLKVDIGHLKNGAGLKKAGVYVILGGSGTLGKVITRHLMQEYNAKVVWIGRQPEISDAIQAEMKSLSTLGEPPIYIQADVTSLEQMKLAVASIKKRYPIINGAIFSGLVFKFEKLDRITENEFLNILNVKTIGSLNFYTIFQDEPLDFMCYFSSIQAFSFTEAANSAAYGTGITFSDTFIRFIRGRAKFPIGAINWGYWKSSAGSTLLSKVELLEDREGIDCFEYFTYYLQEGTLNQIACLRFSESERDLTNIENNEAVTVYEKRFDSIMRALAIHKIEDQEITALFKNNVSEELPMWIAKLLFVQMRQLGLFNQNGIPEEFMAICKKAGIIDKYQRWMEECLGVLETNGYVGIDREQIDRVYVQALENPEPVDQEQVWRDWDLAKELYWKEADWKAQVRLIDACLRKLPEILRGEIPATDIVFPNSSMVMVEEIYHGNVLSDYFNTITANMTEVYVRQRLEADSGTKVRIIEVGAGTGGTSVTVFAKLKPFAGHIEYCYTDISKAFLLFAEDKYEPDNPYLTCKLWNVEKPLAEQGIEAGGYDIVIATNVLHATPNIRQTIRNAKAALKTNGIIIINEIVRKNIFGTLTFGLLDGWWLYQDAQLRIPGSPLLDAETWQKVLIEAGFREVQFPAEAMQKLGQQVIVAESDGIVRQKASDIFHEPSSPTSRRPIESMSMPTFEVSAENLAELVQKMVLDQLAKSLKISRESIDSNVAFSDYGVDSIIGVSFVKQVNDGLGVTMNSAVIFDYTTVNRLTDYIIKTYREQLQKQSALSLSPQKIVKSIDGLFKAGDREAEDSENRTSKIDDNKLIRELEKKFLADDISVDSLLDMVRER
jgi:acyl transferase domain-containing protein/acyl carrier protein/SAM-dependent methyltransferase